MRCLLIVLFVLASASANYAQQYYVVVGAFAKESNAQKFTGYVRSLRYSAVYELNTAKNLYYVYLMKTSQRDAGVEHTVTVRDQSEFKDAWLFAGQLGDLNAVVAVQRSPDKPVQTEITKEEVAPAAIQDEPEITSSKEIQDSPVPQVETSQPAPEPEPAMVVNGQLFKFTIQRLDRFPLKGTVHVVDYDRGRDLATYLSDEYIDLPRPTKGHNPMSVVCGIFGYKEEIKEVDYDNPGQTAGAKQDDKGAWIIPFQLERLKRGDVSVMYHVSFYKDAVVMLPPSKIELDELLSLMKGNPKYKIKIHGHCNGTNSRRIIALGDVKNYFDINGSNEISGSAKDLSRLRAEAVQSYLVENGIEKNRTETYAWGAINMLVSEYSPSAKLNDRIEIEILSH